MTRTPFKSLLALAVLAIPTQDKENWQFEQYSKIPANQVSFSSRGMDIQIQKSASPAFYPLPAPKAISGFRIKGEFLGLPRFADKGRQGDKGADDYALRLGFILAGDKKLSGLKKLFAPTWVKNLYQRVPSAYGLDHVHFFNVTQNPQQLGKKRVHPSSDLIQEEFFATVSQPGPFTYEHNFDQPMNTLGLWLSIDGDDSQSDYAVRIETLELKPQS
jgi:hypothetical protein